MIELGFVSLLMVIFGFFVWVILPLYISWKYDISIKGLFRCVWLFGNGRFEEAHSLLSKKEDRTKPIRWFYWIPFVGRLFIHQRDMKMHPNIRYELLISLIENTLLYFVVGLGGGYMLIIPLQQTILVISIMFLVLLPIEYKLTIWKPKLFLSDGDIEYVEYICVFYHAYLFILSGTLLGCFLKGGYY